MDHITERKKKVVCRTATRVAVGSKCEIPAASSRCPSLQESVRNLELDVNERNQQRGRSGLIIQMDSQDSQDRAAKIAQNKCLLSPRCASISHGI